MNILGNQLSIQLCQRHASNVIERKCLIEPKALKIEPQKPDRYSGHYQENDGDLFHSTQETIKLEKAKSGRTTTVTAFQGANGTLRNLSIALELFDINLQGILLEISHPDW